jgi:hypothetical protein
MQVWWMKACAVIINNCSWHELWKIEILQLHGCPFCPCWPSWPSTRSREYLIKVLPCKPYGEGIFENVEQHEKGGVKKQCYDLQKAK